MIKLYGMSKESSVATIVNMETAGGHGEGCEVCLFNASEEFVLRGKWSKILKSPDEAVQVLENSYKILRGAVEKDEVLAVIRSIRKNINEGRVDNWAGVKAEAMRLIEKKFPPVCLASGKLYSMETMADIWKWLGQRRETVKLVEKILNFGFAPMSTFNKEERKIVRRIRR